MNFWEDWGGARNRLERCNQATSDFRSRMRAEKSYSLAKSSQENKSTSPLNLSQVEMFHFETRRTLSFVALLSSSAIFSRPCPIRWICVWIWGSVLIFWTGFLSFPRKPAIQLHSPNHHRRALFPLLPTHKLAINMTTTQKSNCRGTISKDSGQHPEHRAPHGSRATRRLLADAASLGSLRERPYFPRLRLSFISWITGHGARIAEHEPRISLHSPLPPLTLPPRQHTIPRVRRNRRDPIFQLGATE
jgi:hypothetical protein